MSNHLNLTHSRAIGYFDDPNFDPTTYKSYIFFEHIAKNLNLPKGLCVQLGVGNGFTLGAMKNFFGSDRVLGIDINNHDRNPSVYQVDIEKLTLSLPCAYIENDIAGTGTDLGRQARWLGTQWALKNLITNGVLITSNDYRLGYPVKQLALDSGCIVQDMTMFNNEDWAIDLNTNSPWSTDGYFIIRKI